MCMLKDFHCTFYFQLRSHNTFLVTCQYFSCLFFFMFSQCNFIRWFSNAQIKLRIWAPADSDVRLLGFRRKLLLWKRIRRFVWSWLIPKNLCNFSSRISWIQLIQWNHFHRKMIFKLKIKKSSNALITMTSATNKSLHAHFRMTQDDIFLIFEEERQQKR